MKYTILGLCLILSSLGRAQFAENYYLKIAGGYEKNGYVISSSFDGEISDNSFWSLGVEAQLEKYKWNSSWSNKTEKIPVYLGLASLEYYHKLFSFDNYGYYKLYLGAGILSGYEFIPEKVRSTGEGISKQSKFLYGLRGSTQIQALLFEVGTFKAQGLWLIGSFNYNYLIPSELGNSQPTVQIGLKLTL